MAGVIMETLVCQDMVQVVKKKTDLGDLKLKPIELHLISSAASRVCRQGAHPCSVWSNSVGMAQRKFPARDPRLCEHLPLLQWHRRVKSERCTAGIWSRAC